MIFQATHVFVVPPIVVLLAKHPAVLQYDLSSLKIILVGAAPLGKDTIEEVLQRFPHVKKITNGM